MARMEETNLNLSMQRSEISSTSGTSGVRMAAGKNKSDEMPPSQDDGVNGVQKLSTRATKPRSMPSLCEIHSCEGKQVDSVTFASVNVLDYYRFTNRLAVVKVCSGCQEKAEDSQKKMIDAIRNNEPIFKWKNEPTPVTIDLLDDDDDLPSESKDSAKSDSSSDEIRVDFNKGEVEGLVEQVMKKFSFPGQVDQCKKIATDEAEKLNREMSELDRSMNKVADDFQAVCTKYNEACTSLIEPVVVQEIDICADGTTRNRHILDSVITKESSHEQVIDPTEVEVYNYKKDGVKVLDKMNKSLKKSRKEKET